MSLLDVITGRLPLLKSTQRKQYMRQIETDYAALINHPIPHSLQYTPQPSGDTIALAVAQEAIKSQVVSKRVTLPINTRTKILEDRADAWDVYITIPVMGTTCYATHDGARAISTSAGIHEGIPLTNNPAVAGRPTANHLKWKGELWLSGDTDNMVVDIEAS